MVRKYPRNEWLRNNCVKNTSLGRKSSVKLLNSVPFNMQGHGIAVGRRTLLEDCYIFIQNLFSFSRPHTIFGTLISVFSMSLMARSEGRSLALGKSLVLAALCAVAMNVSIVGLNQVYDKQIDKINKPYLPLASGHFATDTALTVISATCSFAFILGVASSSFHLLFTLLMSLVLGIVYSSDMKLLRWKRVPILATVCILSVRAFLVQWGFFGHFASSLNGGIYKVTPNSLWFSIVFMGVYSIVISLLKDAPDLVGDLQSGIRTLTVRLGVAPILNTCMFLLCLDYLAGIYVGLFRSNSHAQVLVLTGGHLLGIVLIFSKYLRTSVHSSASIFSFYMFVWKMFYMEYLIFPFLNPY